jgi:hypothetical protein
MESKMPFLFLLLVLAIVITSSTMYAQSFYVIPTEKGIERNIIDKMRSDGYKLTENESEADYKVECIATGAYNSVAVIKKKKDFNGYVRITESKSGVEVAKTKEVGKIPSVYNGYQAGPAIMSEIAKKHLKGALDLAVADYKKRVSQR